MKSEKWSIILVWLVLVPLFGTSQPAEKACFSVPGGFYETAPTLEIYPFYAQHHIRFTTNGNRPTAQSRLYTGPLLLDESLYSTSDIYTIQVTPEGQMFYPDSIRHCIVLRAAVFDENDSCISEVATNSYFIHSLGCDTHGLPVVSLCSDSLGLFDFDRGILVPGKHVNPELPDWTGNYFMKGDQWERLCNVEFYEFDNTGINQEAGLRTHGGASRRFQQKGLKIYAREAYGKKRFKHPFFEQTPIDSFKHLSLKPFRCSNWRKTGIQDPLAQQVALPLDFETLAWRETVLFLNGEYWGIYTLEEVPDERYLEDHFDADLEQLHIVKYWGSQDYGDNTSWWALYNWVSQTDFTQDEAYAQFCEKIDMDCFIDYEIFEICSSNSDWPANNVRAWQEGNGRWRWLFYDGDGCFYRDWDVFANAVDTSENVNPSNAHSTLFFRKLIANPTFLGAFVNRFEELLDHTFQYDSIAPVLEYLATTIDGEVPDQCRRFGFPDDYARWVSDMSQIDAFLQVLTTQMRNKLIRFIESIQGVSEQCFLVGFYPNPCSDRVYLVSKAAGPLQLDVCLYDIMGRELLRKQVLLNNGIVDLELPGNLPSGVYILKADDFIAKLIKQ